MQPLVRVKEEVISPADSSCDNVFDRFDLHDNRKLSCSSNESSSVISTASSSDSGCSVSDYLDGKSLLSGNNEASQFSSANSSVVQKNLELHLSGGQKDKIQSILDTVQKLSDTEKLLLYLKLPTRDQDHPITLSNTKQEQTLAFQWIRNNLEECDSSVNLPKHEVYDQYRANAESQGSRRYLSAPDFGKIVKCMFPNVKARRLGTRGNSKYCYNGLRKTVLKESPTLPDLTGKTENANTEEKMNCQSNVKSENDSTDQTFAAACVLVCEWANKLLGRFFTTLLELAKFLVGGSYVSTKSMAAFTVMSATQEKIDLLNKRFSLEALVKSTSSMKDGSAKRSKSTKSVNTPMKTVMGAVKVEKQAPIVSSPAQTVQVVPSTPTKSIPASVELSSNCKDSPVKLENLTVDVNAPVYLEDNPDHNKSVQEVQQNVLMEDVNLIITDADKNMDPVSNSTTSCGPVPNNTVVTPKKTKKIPDRLPISTQQDPYPSEILPQSAPPIPSNGYKTPKKVGRPRSLKKANSSPYPAQSPRGKQQTDIRSPRFVNQQNMLHPSIGVQMNANRFAGWNIPQSHRINRNNDLMSPVENELHNIFMSTRMNLINHPPDLQRCQSVPVPQNISEDIYKPLTPQVHPISVALASPIPMKAKRDLTSLFADANVQNVKELANRNYQMELMMKNRLMNNPLNPHYMNPNVHDERLVPTSYLDRTVNNQGNVNSPFYQRGNNLQNMNNLVPDNNLHTLNDISSILNDLATPDELSDIPASFEQVDSDELLSSLNTNENIWANEWNTTTLSLMNV